MENAGAVTFLEDYVFRSKVTDVELRAAGRDDPARAGAHVVRRPGHHALVGRPVAERVVRHLHRTALPGRGDPVHDAWTTFAITEKTWAYAQDQLPSTHPIAGDIPDVDAVEVNFDGITYAKGASVLKQLVGLRRPRRVPGRRARVLPAARVRQHHPRRPARRAGGDLGPRPRPSGSSSGCETSQVNTLRPVFELTDDGRYASFAIEQTAVAEHPVLRNHRIAVGLYGEGPDGLTRTRAGGARRRRRADRGARAGRAPGRRPGAGQRRRPHLRQAPPRRAVAGHAAHPDRRAPRPAGPRAVLVGRLGHDPRRRAARPRLGAAGARRRGRRDRDQRRPVAARPGCRRR